MNRRGRRADNRGVNAPGLASRTPIGWRLVLLAGPLSIVATVLMLVAGRGYFEHGPGVPSAGRTEAWGLMWLGLALVVAGHAVSTLGLAAYVMIRLRRRAPLPPAAWWSAGYLLLVTLPFLWSWFSG